MIPRGADLADESIARDLAGAFRRIKTRLREPLPEKCPRARTSIATSPRRIMSQVTAGSSAIRSSTIGSLAFRCLPEDSLLGRTLRLFPIR
jgi:hypothetical protein